MQLYEKLDLSPREFLCTVVRSCPSGMKRLLSIACLLACSLGETQPDPTQLSCSAADDDARASTTDGGGGGGGSGSDDDFDVVDLSKRRHEPIPTIDLGLLSSSRRRRRPADDDGDEYETDEDDDGDGDGDLIAALRAACVYPGFFYLTGLPPEVPLAADHLLDKVDDRGDDARFFFFLGNSFRFDLSLSRWLASLPEARDVYQNRRVATVVATVAAGFRDGRC